jgi:hypothetical protein
MSFTTIVFGDIWGAPTDAIRSLFISKFPFGITSDGVKIAPDIAQDPARASERLKKRISTMIDKTGWGRTFLPYGMDTAPFIRHFGRHFRFPFSIAYAPRVPHGVDPDSVALHPNNPDWLAPPTVGRLSIIETPLSYRPFNETQGAFL